MMEIYQPDECCGEHLSIALWQSTALPSPWHCPNCGQEWRATIHQVEAGAVARNWAPHVVTMVFRP